MFMPCWPWGKPRLSCCLQRNTHAVSTRAQTRTSASVTPTARVNLSTSPATSPQYETRRAGGVTGTATWPKTSASGLARPTILVGQNLANTQQHTLSCLPLSLSGFIKISLRVSQICHDQVKLNTFQDTLCTLRMASTSSFRKRHDQLMRMLLG